MPGHLPETVAVNRESTLEARLPRRASSRRIVNPTVPSWQRISSRSEWKRLASPRLASDHVTLLFKWSVDGSLFGRFLVGFHARRTCHRLWSADLTAVTQPQQQQQQFTERFERSRLPVKHPPGIASRRTQHTPLPTHPVRLVCVGNGPTSSGTYRLGRSVGRVSARRRRNYGYLL